MLSWLDYKGISSQFLNQGTWPWIVFQYDCCCYWQIMFTNKSRIQQLSLHKLFVSNRRVPRRKILVIFKRWRRRFHRIDIFFQFVMIFDIIFPTVPNTEYWRWWYVTQGVGFSSPGRCLKRTLSALLFFMVFKLY